MWNFLQSIGSFVGDFLKSNLDKIIIVGVFIYVFHASMGLIYHPGVAEASIAWVRELASGILGCLFGLVNGIAVGKALAAVKPAPPAQGEQPAVNG